MRKMGAILLYSDFDEYWSAPPISPGAMLLSSSDTDETCTHEPDDLYKYLCRGLDVGHMYSVANHPGCALQSG